MTDRNEFDPGTRLPPRACIEALLQGSAHHELQHLVVCTNSEGERLMQGQWVFTPDRALYFSIRLDEDFDEPNGTLPYVHAVLLQLNHHLKYDPL
jgi:hypothetical protein